MCAMAIRCFLPLLLITIQLFGLEADGVTRPVWGYIVSGQYFEVVAIKPYLGRLLERADDDHPGASEAAVITFPAWKNYFAAIPTSWERRSALTSIRTRSSALPQKASTERKNSCSPTSFFRWRTRRRWTASAGLSRGARRWSSPSCASRTESRLPQVQAELDTIAARIQRQNPAEEDGLEFKLARPGMVGDFLGGAVRRFLVRGHGTRRYRFARCVRQPRRPVRCANGRPHPRDCHPHGRWIEPLAHTPPGAGRSLGGFDLRRRCACGLAWMALSGTQPSGIHLPTTQCGSWSSRSHRWSWLRYWSRCSLGLLFGVMPLRQIFKADPNDAIKSGGNLAGAGRRWALRDVLLAAQIALCCVTITAAFVSLRGLGRTLTLDLGFNPRNAVLTTFDLSQAGYSGEAADHIQRRLLERVSQLPGVEAAGYANTTNLTGDNSVPEFFRNKLPISGPPTQPFIPLNTTSLLDIWLPVQLRCSRGVM